MRKFGGAVGEPSQIGEVAGFGKVCRCLRTQSATVADENEFAAK
jgi:hypothetical protein